MFPGSEDIDFSEQNEQTSLKAIQNSGFENSSSNIGHNRPVASGELHVYILHSITKCRSISIGYFKAS